MKRLGGAFLVAAIFGILNFFLGWHFFVVFAIGTLGLAVLLAFITRWIIHAILLKITDAVSDTLTIDSFEWVLGGALLLLFLGSLSSWAAWVPGGVVCPGDLLAPVASASAQLLG